MSAERKRPTDLSRRDALRLIWGIAAAGAAGVAVLPLVSAQSSNSDKMSPIGSPVLHGVDPQQFKAHPLSPTSQRLGAMDLTTYLTHFDYGKVTALSDGTVEREYKLVTFLLDIEVASNVTFPAWTFNGIVPGPTLRATEGDRMKVVYTNSDVHPHTIHFHGIHPSNMDGVYESVEPGGQYTYEFIAEPFGVFPYHCHVMPITKHIAKGLYGTLIIEPKEPRPPAKEMVMVMNGFDVDFDGENEFYTVNGIANHYVDHPIKIKLEEKVRIYLNNMTEFDQINSFHLHANMFWWYPNGTMLTPSEYTDTVMLCQGQRGILEFSYKFPGRYVFHAHQSEFAELGWLGVFEVES